MLSISLKVHSFQESKIKYQYYITTDSVEIQGMGDENGTGCPKNSTAIYQKTVVMALS